MKNKFKRLFCNKLFLSFFINAIVLLLFLLFTRISYETNDDYAISRLIAGFGETSIPYLNALLSGMLGGLQKAVTFCNLFVLYQIVAGCLSFTAITYVFLDKFSRRFSVPASLFVVILFGFNHYALLQYTKTAYLLSVAGFLLLIHALYKRKSIWMCIMGALLALFGCFTRLNSFFVAAVFTAVFLLAFFFTWIIEKAGAALISLVRTRKKYLISWLLFFLLALSSVIASAQIYSGRAGYDEYSRFNGARAATLDYPIPAYQSNQEFYAKLGLSQNDLNIYRSWNIDTNVFTVEKLEQIAALQKEQKESVTEFYSLEIKKFLRIYRHSFPFRKEAL